MSFSGLPLIIGLLVFLRFIGFLASAPLFSMSSLPWRIKISLAIAASILVTSSLQLETVVPTSLPMLGLLGVTEVVCGLGVGFVMSLFIHGVRMGGQLAGIQMGLGFSALVDPMTGDRSTVLSRLLGLTTLIVILAFNGHHVMLRGLADSFKNLPPGTAWMSLATAARAIPAAGATLFVTAVLVGAPALATVFCLKVGMALMARAAPQLHILTVGFIITILVGVLTIAMTLSGFGDVVRSGFEKAARQALDLCALG